MTQEIASFFMAKDLKWVEVRNGKYKLVGVDDPRPEVKIKRKRGAPNIQYVPSWKKYQEPMYVGTANEQIDAMEKFTAERDNEIRRNPRAARWEKSRKDWFAKQKPAWRKKRVQEV